MNRERARELLPIIEAYANGEEIQLRAGTGWFTFDDTEPPDFLDSSEYRIKPEPREFWLAEIETDENERTKYVDCSDAPSSFIDVIKVREVL